MKRLSVKKLADMLNLKRYNLDLTQEQLSALTGINRAMIGRIERMNFIPSIAQLESLATVLKFNITEIKLLRSERSKEGIRYTEVSTIPLNG